MMVNISFQGVEGAYSHLAIKEVFKEANIVSCKTFEETLKKVENGDCDKAMIPVENSYAGRVADIHRLLPSSNLKIEFEHFLKVDHHLMIHPSTSIENISKVISHEQALSQCDQFIKGLGLIPIVAADTAGSAKKISEESLIDTAAIASSLAADYYQLNIVNSHIASTKDNTTRFLIMSKLDVPTNFIIDKQYITSLIFSVKDTPGSLFKALGGFATNNVNMYKLESYNRNFKSAEFYAEVQGQPDLENVKLALDDLSHYCTEVKILGIFPESDFRNS